MKSRAPGAAVVSLPTAKTSWWVRYASLMALVGTVIASGTTAWVAYDATVRASADRTSQGLSDYLRGQRQSVYAKLRQDLTSYTDAGSQTVNKYAYGTRDGIAPKLGANYNTGAVAAAFSTATLQFDQDARSDLAVIDIVGSDTAVRAAHGLFDAAYALVNDEQEQVEVAGPGTLSDSRFGASPVTGTQIEGRVEADLRALDEASSQFLGDARADVTH